MQRPAADARRKNDRRDAEFIARMLATHNIVEVPLPDMAVEAARDLDRALDDATRELRRSRQRLNMFLIRLGHVWDERNADGARKKAWTRAHWRWVSEIRLEGPQRDALEYYVTAARCAESDRRQLERRVVALAGTDRWRATVEALSCIKGVDTLTAFRLAAEAGSFSRFRSAPAFASWCGLIPSEHSSGEFRAARRDNQGRQRARAHGAHRVRMALLHVLPEAQGPSPRHRRAPGDTLEGGRLHRQAPPPPRGAGRGGQERVQGQRRRGARARLLGLGDRVQVRGDRPLAAGDNRLPPGGPAPRRIAGASSRPF